MLVQNIRSPIQRVVQNATGKTIRSYRRSNLFIKNSKHVITVAIFLFLFGAMIVIAIPGDEKTATFYFATVSAEEAKGEATPPVQLAPPVPPVPLVPNGVEGSEVEGEIEVILPNIDGELETEETPQESAEKPVEEGSAGGGGNSPGSTAGEAVPTEEVPEEQGIDIGDEKTEEEAVSEITIPPEEGVQPPPVIFTNSQELLIFKFVSESGPLKDEYPVKRVQANPFLAPEYAEGRSSFAYYNYPKSLC